MPQEPQNTDTQRERSDENHVMLGGKLVRKTYILSDDQGNPLQGMDKDGVTGNLDRGDKSPVIDTATLGSFKGNFPQFIEQDPNDPTKTIVSDKHWNDQAGMSMDGLLIPYSAEFVTTGPQGSLTNVPIPSGDLPSFWKPVGIGNESLIDWWNVGSGVITSATLNPLASGHNIEYVVRNSDMTDLSVRSIEGGYAKSARPLGKIAEITSQNTDYANQAARPIGLRGPMVVSGWGYDIDGRPVPNAKYDADRRVPYSSGGGGDVDNVGLPVELQHSKTRAHLNFLPHHLQRTDSWKRGPVDLRWDRERKVWGGGRFNGVYLSKAVKCILPKAGLDGKNSFNFGINDNVTNPGRLYRNPCPQTSCTYETYFNTSIYYPDIEIYDPEDKEWCGNCEVVKIGTGTAAKYAVECSQFSTTCTPFYDAVIVRSVDHTVRGRNVYSDCGDKFSKVSGGSPQSRRMGDPCHRFGGSALAQNSLGPEPLHAIMPPIATGVNAKYSEAAKAILYQKILIENPLNQGLMLGDSFLSYDTGRRVAISYSKSDRLSGCSGGDPITVQEILPVHVILQAEFFSAEVLTHANCSQGEFSNCTKKLFFQGMSTLEDCGPDDDYPQTAITT